MNSKMEIMLKNEKIPKTSVAKILKISEPTLHKKIKENNFSIQDLVKLEQVFGKSSFELFARLTGQEEKWENYKKQNNFSDENLEIFSKMIEKSVKQSLSNIFKIKE